MITDLPLAILDWLNTSEELMALIGDRIYPDHLPQSCSIFPALLYQLPLQAYPSHLDGGDGTTQASVRLIVCASSYAEAEPVADILRSLDSVEAPAGFEITLFAGENEDYDLLFASSAERRVQIVVEFLIHSQVPV